MTVAGFVAECFGGFALGYYGRTVWTWGRSVVKSRSSRKSIPLSDQTLPQSPSASPNPSSPPPSPLIGWRGWRAEPSEDGYKLWSPLYRVAWDGPTVDTGSTPYHDRFMLMSSIVSVPHPWMGFHAAREREKAASYYGDLCSLEFRNPTAFEPRLLDHFYAVLGQVECHGSVLEYDGGWRAQKCTVRSLTVFVNDPRLIADLERRYQCDVTVETPVTV